MHKFQSMKLVQLENVRMWLYCTLKEAKQIEKIHQHVTMNQSETTKRKGQIKREETLRQSTTDAEFAMMKKE